jgi:hypothetical protein
MDLFFQSIIILSFSSLFAVLFYIMKCEREAMKEDEQD